MRQVLVLNADSSANTILPNLLQYETSTYLLQHANNPVEWLPWGDVAWNKAKAENKLVIISIGYSACHWCHVMERECFENEDVAKLMNENYICIKVDREERPDVDMLYMDACNLMIGRGGWPLNAIALPDGRPVYAGTYFPRNQWTGILKEVAAGYKYRTKNYIEYAEKLMRGINTMNELVSEATDDYIWNDAVMRTAYNFLSAQFDKTHGGKGMAPKFMMPSVWRFLLRINFHTKNTEALDHTFLTLNKMAQGGLYDQLGGGFARYSTDDEWRVPHFEKMLYDNAQLLSLYSEAYRVKNDSFYKQICYDTTAFIMRELTSKEGGCYCALDADSEGEEGKFYVWNEPELDSLLGEDSTLIKYYFGVGQEGYWEHGNSILVNHKTVYETSVAFGITADETLSKINSAKQKLFEKRSERIRPGLDNKILTSWNALTISGLAECYKSFGDDAFLKQALQINSYIQTELTSEGKLCRTKKKAGEKIPAFLEDYALYILALTDLYEITFKEEYLLKAQAFATDAIANFYDAYKGYFYFTSKHHDELAARKIELSDNVIPSPNSAMAHALFRLGKLLGDDDFLKIAARMLNGVVEQMKEHIGFYSNWGSLFLFFQYPFFEVAITSGNMIIQSKKLQSQFLPHAVFMGADKAETKLPLLQGKFTSSENNFYICTNKTCGLPLTNTDLVLQQLLNT